MKKPSLFLSIIVLPLILFSQITSGEITTEKQRLLILPAEYDKNPQSVENETASIVADVATRLGRFEVIDRNNLEKILNEQALQLTGLISDSMVVEVGNIAAAHEALIVNVLNFYQQGVPPEEDENEDEDEENGKDIWGKIIVTVVEGIVESTVSRKEKERDPFAHNIQTTLSTQVKKINIETGKTLDSFRITTAHTGGNRGYSRAHVMENFRRQTLTQMKQFYALTSEVISVRGSEALLFLGSEIGVKRGTLFEIVQPDRVRTIREKEVVIPGRRVGIVQVRDSSSEANRSIILRNWRSVRSGDKALEYTQRSFGLELNYFQTVVNPFSGINIGFLFFPFHPSYYGANFRFASTTDTSDEKDFVFGFGGFGGRRFMKSSSISIAGKLGLNLDLAFRSDDANHTVVTALFSAIPQCELEFLLSENRDLTINLGYRLGRSNSHWTYSKADDEGNPAQVDAEWEGNAPTVDLSGLFLTVGLKFISF